jgi:light-regulated signal transduction histidine kinase (bacteriophytochrome)
LNSNRQMSGERSGAGLKLTADFAALFCTAALGYLAGIHQTQATPGVPAKPYVLNFGREHLTLSVGAFGVAVILALTVLLLIATLLTIISRRRKMRIEAANRNLSSAIQDITKLEQADAALRRQRSDLARANAELSSANKELESFSYSVSHDLRAPLRAIDGFSQALLEEYSDRLDSPGRVYLERVRHAAQRMSRLIDDLLNLSRVTRSPIHHEILDLSAMAQSIAEELRQEEPGRQVEFMIEDGLKATGDAQLMRAGLENLIRNSWKYTSGHVTAKIEFGRIQRNGTSPYFVRDDGAGFDPHYADRLFGAFQRLHTEAEFPGTGIGLATVQRIIHRHGGEIWAEGAVEKGATFYFTL